jgi:hypothetical protein
VQVLEPDGNLPSLAVVDLGDTDGAVRVRLGKVTAGMGVAVRVLDAGNYLAVEAAPGYGTFAVRRSVNGQMTELGGVGLVRAADNSVLEIRMRGNSIDIYVDSVFKKTFVDRPRQGATRVGMIGEAGSAAARWTMFEAQDNAALTEGDPLPDVAVEDDTSPDGTTGTTTVED